MAERLTTEQLHYQPLGRANSDIVKGMRFCATLQLRTPLIALERHGEVRPVDSELPSYGPTWAGIWVAVVKPLNEILRDGGSKLRVRDFQPSTMASQWGPIPSDGGDLLPTLIAYRRIVESDQTFAAKAIALRELQVSSEAAAKYLPLDIERRWAAEAIDEALAIGPVLAARLVDAGFVDVATVRASPDEALLDVRGLGPNRLAAIRAAIAS